MLRKFKISIDNKEYLVEMEEVGVENRPTPEVVAASVQQEKTAEASKMEEAEVAQPKTSAPASEDALTAPMPGTILKLLTNVGDAVKQNQPIMILEAMKMENEIVANHDGIVKGIHVKQGDVVNPGDPLITID
ncbi:acetyl-CoA carboxylase biotin carboxyl carrier protein subunit [Enterococcus casseliflavus]|uniref:acetyl-CoA carboxylase biotin carboxyl carrier protein subunit n=1 Tax=Enterococcus casseliflavus TaxID=37734 RepID=UPI0018843E48|nr:acetyl-CoA carboxylase biotin carboxyl carrier protein subunit [Enterococcus casseliflavus]MBE9909422.1 acetyl-CoA carboxylase biotin carboxyl carrier protein subunit [Enterococcus casseliflavus]